MNAAKRTLAVTVFLLAALLSAAFLPLYAHAEVTASVVHIFSDGTIEPSSAPIQRSGNTFVFTGDLYTQGIVIAKEGITLDGAGYTLRGPYDGSQTLWIIGEGPDQTMPEGETELWSIGVDTATNAIGDLTIKNLNIKNFSIGMYLWTPNNMVTANAFTNCIVGVLVSGDDNTIVGNYIENNKNGIFFGSNNQEGNIPANLKISENRFLNNIAQLGGCLCGDDYNTTEPIHTWDDGAKGNFWSDYNGTDTNGDGIGDTPYIIDPLNRDRYPLMTSSIVPPTVAANLPMELVYAVFGLAAVAIVVVAVFKLRRSKPEKVFS